MGNSQKTQYIGFEDIQHTIKSPAKYILMNTLTQDEQNCLIVTTVAYTKEEELINSLLTQHNKKIKIIIYGKNSCDHSVFKKQSQLINLGFQNVYIYLGGIFEWLLLQDIYGTTEFQTTTKQNDILKYKPGKVFGNEFLLEY